MAMITPPPRGGGTDLEIQLPNLPRSVQLLLLIPLLAVLGFSYWWFVQRVEVPANHVLVLVRRWGEPLPAYSMDDKLLSDSVREQIVLYPALLEELGESADSNRYQGVKYEVVKEGRYFYDPFLWGRYKVPAVQIEQDKVGIPIRKYGKSLPQGKIVATEPDERGPLADVLTPGRHNINPHAYEVKQVDQVRIEPGEVGVQTLYHGDEPESPNTWVVQEGERGVQPVVLSPGLYYNNPFVRQIDTIDVRSHTLDLRGEQAIVFPSKDSFEITLEATVEYAVRQDMAPYVMVAIGDHADIESKLILPYARSLARIEGSKLLAKEFISGKSREAFQQAVFEGLREQCGRQGIDIKATPVRRIEPPEAIANPISDRQLAAQQITRFRSEMSVAEAQALRVQEDERQKQNIAIGAANREVVTQVVQSEQDKSVALVDAQKRLEVARLNLQAAEEEAAALRSRGKAQADVVLLQFKAEAEPLRDAINAFGDGESYAQFFFYQKLSPSLRSILASTDGPFADIFADLARGGSVNVSAPAPVDTDSQQVSQREGGN